MLPLMMSQSDEMYDALLSVVNGLKKRYDGLVTEE